VGVPSVTVREAAPGEYAETGELTVEAYREYESAIPGEFWEWYEADLRDIARKAERSTILVAEIDGRLAGCVALSAPGTPERAWPEDWASVRALAVSPAYRRRGVARALMDACVARARAWGAAAVGLNTVEFMRAAVAMYEQMGLVHLPEYEHIGQQSGTLVYAFGLELVAGGLDSGRGAPV
jgi:GNAT superfamily N-acetyltransferase